MLSEDEILKRAQSTSQEKEYLLQELDKLLPEGQDYENLEERTKEEYCKRLQSIEAEIKEELEPARKVIIRLALLNSLIEAEGFYNRLFEAKKAMKA